MKSSKLKFVLISLAAVLVVFGAIGGTIAWLVTDTAPVTNTFTYGDINITLTETDTNKDGDNDPNTNTYPMVPGNEITKDPTITVAKDSEKAWLFVKVVENGGEVTVGTETYSFDDYLTYEIDSAWTALDGNDGVYYMVVDKADSAQSFPVIKDNKVTVSESVTKEMLNALDKNADGTEKTEKEYPVISIKSYAVQHDGVASAADAWAQIPEADKTF